MLTKIFAVIDKVFSFFEDWVLFISTMAALIALFANVILRYGFNYSLAWSEELVREVIIVTTFIGVSAATKARAMIKVDALIQLVPVTKYPIMFFASLVSLLFSAMMFVYGWRLTALQASTEQTTVIMEIPLEYLYSVLPLMGVMVFIRTLMVMHQDWKQLQKDRAAKPA